MGELILVRPTIDMREAILDYRREHFEHGERHINGSYGLHRAEDVDAWIREVISIENETLTDDDVHASTFFSVRKSDGRMIGSVQLRHELKGEILEHAGSIGYGIRPTERRKGYGREQLELILDVARGLNIKEALLTCIKENAASRSTIQSCGGVLMEEKLIHGDMHQFFWITL